MSYQVNTATGWDTEWFHELMKPRIKSSLKSQEVRKELANQGALPAFDNNYDWAMFCIAYCFAKDLIPHLETASDAKGSEIPNFETCFQKEARLWLAYLSDALFELKQGKPCTRDDLYQFIQDLWHTGAVELEKRWYAYRKNNEHSELDAQKQFLEELAKLAQKHSNSRKKTAPSSLHTESPANENTEMGKKIVEALQSIGKGVKKQEFLCRGVKYDFYLIQFSEFNDWDKLHKQFCSAMGISWEDNVICAEPYSGLPYAYEIKILRDEKDWDKYEKAEFQAALSQYKSSDKLYQLPVCLGLDKKKGTAVFQDFANAPHAIVAGATGMGKSVVIRAMLFSLFELLSPNDVEIAIIYCKQYDDFAMFSDYPHLWRNQIIRSC